jgi:hypothetical protein
VAEILERSFTQNASLERLASFEDLSDAQGEPNRPEPSLPWRSVIEEVEQDSCDAPVVRIDSDHGAAYYTDRIKVRHLN